MPPSTLLAFPRFLNAKRGSEREKGSGPEKQVNAKRVQAPKNKCIGWSRAIALPTQDRTTRLDPVIEAPAGSFRREQRSKRFLTLLSQVWCPRNPQPFPGAHRQPGPSRHGVPGSRQTFAFIRVTKANVCAMSRKSGWAQVRPRDGFAREPTSRTRPATRPLPRPRWRVRGLRQC
jgi:hypothetical protein